MSLVTVYFDAAYNHFNRKSPDTPLLHTVTAYVGRKRHWDELRKAWRVELRRVGLEWFHMTDFEFARSRVLAGLDLPTRNPFYGWSEDEFVPFLQRLHSLIGRKNKRGAYYLEGASSHIIKSDFDETRPQELKDDVQCASYYITNVVNVMKGIALWADRQNHHDPIHYVFAGGDGESGNLKRLFTDMWNDPVAPHRFRLTKASTPLGYDIEWTKAEPALQAVDCAAFDMNKANLEWIKRGYVDMHVSELRKSLGSLVGPDQWGWVLNKEKLRLIFADIIEHNTNRQRQRAYLKSAHG